MKKERKANLEEEKWFCFANEIKKVKNKLLVEKICCQVGEKEIK